MAPSGGFEPPARGLEVRWLCPLSYEGARRRSIVSQRRRDPFLTTVRRTRSPGAPNAGEQRAMVESRRLGTRWPIRGAEILWRAVWSTTADALGEKAAPAGAITSGHYNEKVDARPRGRRMARLALTRDKKIRRRPADVTKVASGYSFLRIIVTTRRHAGSLRKDGRPFIFSERTRTAARVRGMAPSRTSGPRTAALSPERTTIVARGAAHSAPPGRAAPRPFGSAARAHDGHSAPGARFGDT